MRQYFLLVTDSNNVRPFEVQKDISFSLYKDVFSTAQGRVKDRMHG